MRLGPARRIENVAPAIFGRILNGRARESRGQEALKSGLLFAGGVGAFWVPDRAGGFVVAFLTGLAAALALICLIRGLRQRAQRRQTLLLAAALGLGAWVLFAHPAPALLLVGLIAVVFLADGALRLIATLPDRAHPRRLEFLVTGAASLAFGAVLSFTPARHDTMLIGGLAGFALLVAAFKSLRALWGTRTPPSG